MVQHILSQSASSPHQSTASFLKQRVSCFALGKLFAKVVYCILFSTRLVMLTQHTSHRILKHCEVHNQRSSLNWREQNGRFKQIFFDVVKSFLTIFIPYTSLIFL